MELKKIRILHINNVMGYGGVEKIVYQLSHIAKRNFQDVVVASNGGIFSDKLKEEGITTYWIPDISTHNLKNASLILKTLKRIIVKHKINIIHCHHRMAVFYAKLVVGKNQNIKIIYNNHTIYSDKRFFSSLLLRDINLIADGEQAKVNLIDFFEIKKNNITVIDNAVDSFDGKVSAIPEIDREREAGNFIVIDAARLHPQKGFQYFIEAADYLVKQSCKIHFFIVGEGELKEKLVDQVNNLCLNKYITFLGFRNDIKNVLLHGDVTVLTSIYEGLPLTPMESFSVKKAVIGTNIPGTREVIHDGKNGLLAETKNPKSIAEKIYKVYENRALLDKLNQGAYNSYINEFSMKRFEDNYLKYYLSI